jgi:hypothetical protein
MHEVSLSMQDIVRQAIAILCGGHRLLAASASGKDRIDNESMRMSVLLRTLDGRLPDARLLAGA